MNNQINIETEKVLDVYKNSNCEQKALLENLFGKEIFKPKDIKELVKSFEDACNILGEDSNEVQTYRAYKENLDGCFCGMNDIEAFLKLRIITAALNQGWSPNWLNEDEYKYFPWFCLYTEDEYNNLDEDDKERCCRVVGRSGNSAGAYGGFVCASANDASSYSDTYSGSRLAFKTCDLALYAGKQFINEWCDFLF